MTKKHCFTLAEVLITLAIIGVVAALTIPTLWDKISQKVSENQQKVFQAKLIKGLNLAKTSGDLHDKYTSTEDFLRNGLAKHYKMSAICGADNIKDCIPYKEIHYFKDGEEKTMEVSKIKKTKAINIEKEGFNDIAAFVTMDGIPVIISYDVNCTVDTEKLDQGISSCVAGIYDLNGSKLPNKYGFTLNDDGSIAAFINDIRSFNGAGIGSTDLFNFEIVAKANYSCNDDIYSAMGSPKNGSLHDCWTAAKKYCQERGARLPQMEEAIQIARILYNEPNLEINDIKTFAKKKTYSQDYNGNVNGEAIASETLGIPTIKNTSYGNIKLYKIWLSDVSGSTHWVYKMEPTVTYFDNSDSCSSGDAGFICVK